MRGAVAGWAAIAGAAIFVRTIFAHDSQHLSSPTTPMWAYDQTSCRATRLKLLTGSAGTGWSSGLLNGKRLRCWHNKGHESSKIRSTLRDGLLIGLQRGGQVRNRLIRTLEVKCARQVS